MSDDQADLRVFLDAAPDEVLVWLLSHLAGRPLYMAHAWPNRQRSIDTILAAERTLTESDPRRDVLKRLLHAAPASALGGTLEVEGG